jgi:ATP-binding cassette, subfamily B, bacterial
MVGPSILRWWRSCSAALLLTGSGRGVGRHVLDGVSFTVASDGYVALVGASGAGKSTIFSLISRFHEPDHGEICIGGTPIGALNLAESRSRIGLLEQHAPLLFGSLRDNISYGAPDATDADIATPLS